jgi:nicotinic acid phosphoribosyltransferase
VLAAVSACDLNFVIVYFGLRSSDSAAVAVERVSAAAVQNLCGHRNLPGQHWHGLGKMGRGGAVSWKVQVGLWE